MDDKSKNAYIKGFAAEVLTIVNSELKILMMSIESEGFTPFGYEKLENICTLVNACIDRIDRIDKEAELK